MKKSVVQALDALGQAWSAGALLFPLGRIIFDLAALIAVAQLQPPTHRRRLSCCANCWHRKEG